MRYRHGACLVMMLSSPAMAADLDDFTCRNEHGDAVRIVVETDNIETGLPCWVILWRSADEHEIIWRALRTRDFCTDKLREMIDRFTVNGLSCAPTPRAKRYEMPFYPKGVM